MEKRKCKICGLALAGCNRKDICFCHQSDNDIIPKLKTTVCTSRNLKRFNKTIYDYYGPKSDSWSPF